MTVPCILPEVGGEFVLDFLWLCLQDPQASQNVLRSVSQQMPQLDIKVKLEVHCDAELHKDQ